MGCCGWIRVTGLGDGYGLEVGYLFLELAQLFLVEFYLVADLADQVRV